MSKRSEERFSEDPEENLRIENEILKLKMQAESNAVIMMDNEMPPEIENLFLRNVQQFEEAFQNAKQVKLYDYICRPDYLPESILNDEEIPIELERLNTIMESNNVCLHVEGSYDPRVIYRFITEELFQHETDDMQIPGMTQNFSYEEFHPNHQLDIQRRTMDFIENWFERKFDQYCWELNDTFTLPAGITVSKEEVLARLQRVFDSFTSFSNVNFALEQTCFELNESKDLGRGQVNGTVKYNAVIENGEIVPFQGTFAFYLSYESNWWNIHYFEFPGFVW